MNFKSYQEEDVPNKDAAAAVATKKSSLTVGKKGEESKSKSKSKLKRWQTTPGIVAAIVVAIILFVVVVSSPSSLHGIRGIGGGGGGGGASIMQQQQDVLQQNHDPMCPTTGSPHPHNDGSTQTPGVVYYGLDFSTRSYRNSLIYDKDNKGKRTYFTEQGGVWQGCALECNADTACRTFTVHVKEATDFYNKWYGRCYFHEHWLDNHGSDFVKNSLKKRSIVSGVCRPEDRWNGYK